MPTHLQVLKQTLGKTQPIRTNNIHIWTPIDRWITKYNAFQICSIRLLHTENPSSMAFVSHHLPALVASRFPLAVPLVLPLQTPRGKKRHKSAFGDSCHHAWAPSQTALWDCPIAGQRHQWPACNGSDLRRLFFFKLPFFFFPFVRTNSLIWQHFRMGRRAGILPAV